MGSFLNCGAAKKTGRSRQASKLLKACSAITGLGPVACRPCWYFDFWLCGLIIFCHMKTDCVINANWRCQWKYTYTCRWLRLDEPRLGPIWQFRQTSEEKSQNWKFRMVGRCNFFFFFLFTDKNTRVGVDTGSFGLVETRVFFYALIQNIMHHWTVFRQARE